MNTILKYLGEVVLYGGFAAAFAYGIFNFLGKKWIESKFQDRLEIMRHDHAKELERLKVEINTLLNRLTRLQDKEFEVITDLWSKLNDSIGKLSQFVSMFQSYPDLETMTPQRLEEFFSKSRLAKSEINEIQEDSNKNNRYQEIIFHHDYHDVKQTYVDFHTVLIKNRIFLSEQLAKLFTTIDDQMWDVFQKRSIGKQFDDLQKWFEASSQMRDEIQPSLNELETNIKAILNRQVE